MEGRRSRRPFAAHRRDGRVPDAALQVRGRSYVLSGERPIRGDMHLLIFPVFRPLLRSEIPSRRSILLPGIRAQQLGPPVARPCAGCISHFSTRGVRIFLVSPPLAGRAYTCGAMMDIRIRASRTAVVRQDTIYVCSRAGNPPQSRPPLGDGGTEHGGLMVASDWHHLRAATSDVMHQFWIAMRRAKELAPDVIAHLRWAFADSSTDELFRIRIELIASGSPESARVCETRGALSMSEPPLSKFAQQMAKPEHCTRGRRWPCRWRGHKVLPLHLKGR